MVINFILRKSPKELQTIYVRLISGLDVDIIKATEFKINAKNWNVKRQEVKNVLDEQNKDFINSKLRELKNFLINKFNATAYTNTELNKTWLENSINEFFNVQPKKQNNLFMVWIDDFVNKHKTELFRGKQFTISRLQRFSVVRNKINAFEIHNKYKLSFQNIDMKFYDNFIFYCKNIEHLNNNSIGTYIKTFKFFCAIIESENLPINPDYKSRYFVLPTNKIDDVYLNENEILDIFNFDFADNERLNRARDIFIIGLNTGLRVSDFMRLNKGHIKGDFIEIVTKKTKTLVVIPINQQIKTTLKKWCGYFPQNTSEGRTLTEQKLNAYIKEICEKVGICEKVTGSKIISHQHTNLDLKNNPVVKNYNRKVDGVYPKYELITTHSCRRSFATNWHNKIPTISIMAITGHTTETEFLKYLKKSKQEHANIMNNYNLKNETNGI